MSPRAWRRWHHRLRRIGQVGAHRNALLVEATVRLLVARVAIATVPFPRIARHIGGFMPPADARAMAGAVVARSDADAIAREIGWAVTRAARHIPFEAVCLPQAIAAHAMLRRRGVFAVIHFGTATAAATTTALEAHAWLDAGTVEVTGYPVGAHFTEIACIA